MTLHQWIGVTIGLLLVGFIFFAFRQGEKVKRAGGSDAGVISDGGDHSGTSSP
jgi:cbb3-type cytochrome oxidase subunit 3